MQKLANDIKSLAGHNVPFPSFKLKQTEQQTQKDTALCWLRSSTFPQSPAVLHWSINQAALCKTTTFFFFLSGGAYLRWQLCIWLMRCSTRMRVPEWALRLRSSAGLRCGPPLLLLVITRARAGKLTTTPIHRGEPRTKLAYKYVRSFPKCTHTHTHTHRGTYIQTNDPWWRGTKSQRTHFWFATCMHVLMSDHCNPHTHTDRYDIRHEWLWEGSIHAENVDCAVLCSCMCEC